MYLYYQINSMLYSNNKGNYGHEQIQNRTRVLEILKFKIYNMISLVYSNKYEKRKISLLFIIYLKIKLLYQNYYLNIRDMSDFMCYCQGCLTICIYKLMCLTNVYVLSTR